MILLQYTCDGNSCTQRICTRFLNPNVNSKIPDGWRMYKDRVFCSESCEQEKPDIKHAYLAAPKSRINTKFKSIKQSKRKN